MDLLTNLLLLYAGVLVINMALAGALWWRNRVPLYRALFFVWGSTAVSFLMQGGMTQNDLAITYGFASVFLVNVALAHLMSIGLGVSLRVRWYIVVLLVSL